MTIDIECETLVIYRRAGLHPDDVPGAHALARGNGYTIRYWDPSFMRGCDALVYWPRGRSHAPEIALRKGMTDEREQWSVGHELSEGRIAELDYRGEDVEQLAHALTAALLMPRSSFREAAREHGDDLAALAADYLCEQTAAALRLAETRMAEAVAVVAPTRVYVCAPDDFVMPPERELRRAARGGHPGLRRVPVTDARRRVALVA